MIIVIIIDLYLYHEKRIALVNNFVCLVPLKNIVQGRKGYLKVDKKSPWKSFFSLFYPSASKWKSEVLCQM
jgi:hypothetical protein